MCVKCVRECECKTMGNGENLIQENNLFEFDSFLILEKEIGFSPLLSKFRTAITYQ